MNLELRHLKQTDLKYLLTIENDKQYWHLSGTTQPYTKEELTNYIENSAQSIEVAKQLRFVIEVNNQFTGLIDLYEYNTKEKIAGVGIFILKTFRNKGIATKALNSLKEYVKFKLKLKFLFARIEDNNFASIKAFENTHFTHKLTLKNYLNKGIYKVDCSEYWIDLQ